MTRKSTPTAKFVTGDAVFAGWRDNVLTGTGPVVFPHALPVPEISPGHVTLLGGAPGAGKTALVMQCVVEALRHTGTLRALVANVEMSPAALLDRQLARLSGIEAEAIRHRRFTAEHADRLDAGLATVESFVDRLRFSNRRSTWRTWPMLPTPTVPTWSCSTTCNESCRRAT